MPATYRGALRTAGFLLRGTGPLAQRAAAADAAVRAPVGTSRRITFLAADGGTGTTTLTASFARLLAARRSGPVLALDAAGGVSGLALRCGADGSLPLEVLARRDRVRSLAQAAEGLPAAGRLRLAGAAAWNRPVPVWNAAHLAIGRFFEVVVTDAGRRTAAEAVALATMSHCVAVVARTDAGSLAAAGELVRHLRAAVPGVPVRLVAAAVAEDAFPGSAAAAGPAGADAEPLLVPHDDALASSLGAPLPRTGLPVVTAVTEVAAALLSATRNPVRAVA